MPGRKTKGENFNSRIDVSSALPNSSMKTLQKGDVQLESLSKTEKKNKLFCTGQSKCHPYLIPRHWTITKFIGGMAHVATLGFFVGIGKLRGRKLWPGFTNDEEICLNCNDPPSANGCLQVDKPFTLQNENIKTSHSTKLDRIQIEN